VKTDGFTGCAEELQSRVCREVENWSDAYELQVLRKSRLYRLVGNSVVYYMDWSVWVECKYSIYCLIHSIRILPSRLHFVFSHFLNFTARCYAERAIRRYCYGKSSVCDLSITLRHRDHIGWKSSKIMSLLVSLWCSLSVDPNITDLLQREHPIILTQRDPPRYWIVCRTHSIANCGRTFRE